MKWWTGCPGGDINGDPFAVVNDDVYEGTEGLSVTIDGDPTTPAGLVQFAYPDGTTCEPSCATTPAYPVTITDEEDRPELSLVADPASIAEEDDSATTNIAENVSTLAVSATNAKTFATDQVITLTFSGAADYGTHYSVTPTDADGAAEGHQVTLPAETASVSVTVTAAANDTNDGNRIVSVAGDLDGTGIGSTTITIVDDDATTTAPEVTVSETALTVTEEDATGNSYTVVLETQPTADVVVTVAGHAGTEVTPAPNPLTFTTTNWNTAQTVTVTAGDDADLMNETVTLTHSAVGTDTVYNGIPIAAVTVTVNDNDRSNTPPVFTGGTTQTRTLAETMGGARVGTAAAIGDPVAATDADDEPLPYSLGGTDAGKFDFLASSAQLRTKANERYDFEAQPSYAVTVTVDDGRVSVSAAVTISLTDVDEPPLAPAAPTVTATPNATDSLSVSWSAPSNTGRPAIDSYDLQYREGTTGTWTDGPQNVSGTSTTIAGLAADPAAYQVQVRATNDEGDGPWSPTGRIGGGGGGARNDPPLAVDDAAETVEGTAVFIDVLANDSDPNGDTLTVVDVSAPAHGTAVVAAAAAAGTVEYTPEPDFHGTDRFTYVVGDGSGLTARAAVEVTALPVNAIRRWRSTTQRRRWRARPCSSTCSPTTATPTETR